MIFFWKMYIFRPFLFRLLAVVSCLCAVLFAILRYSGSRITIVRRQPLLLTENPFHHPCPDTLWQNLSPTTQLNQVWRFRRAVKILKNSDLSAASSSSQVSGRSVRSSASLQSIASLRSTGSGSSWFSVNSLSSFQCANLDRNHNNKPRVRAAEY